jgi:hypothetical protein
MARGRRARSCRLSLMQAETVRRPRGKPRFFEISALDSLRKK